MRTMREIGEGKREVKKREDREDKGGWKIGKGRSGKREGKRNDVVMCMV